MKDLIKTLFTTSSERLKNPFIGTFIFAWIAFNWKPISVLILSDDSIILRLKYIETEYSQISHQIWLPLLFALFYILILPYLFTLSNGVI